MLAYLGLTVGLRLPLVVIDRLTGGARWARSGLQVSNLITVPAVRRIVDGGVAGTLLISSWLPQSSRVAAAVEPVAVVALAPPLHPADLRGRGPDLEPMVVTQEEVPQYVAYTVVRGDYLWEIARRFYGDGSRFVEIFEANQGRTMTAGERFTDPRLIRPGWQLRIPLPAANLVVEDEVLSYRVRRGDHLWGIAERFLGDGFRWVEIWQRNQGRELSRGQSFSDPNLIYPGWLLELPIAVAPSDASASTPTEPPVAPSSAPTVAPSPEASVPPRGASPAGETAPAVKSDDEGGWSWEWPTLPRPVVVTAAGFAVIRGAAVFVQRLMRDGRLPVPGRGARSSGSPGDAGRVALATRSLTRALADYGFEESLPVLVHESGSRLTFTVQCPVGDAEALGEHGHDLQRRLACDAHVDVIGSTRVTVTLRGFQRLAGLLADDTGASVPALIVPVGADDAGIVYLNIAAVGSVAVAGTDHERRQLLRAWVSTLTTTHAPQELALRFEAATARALGDYATDAHSGGALPDDQEDLVAELEELIDTRSSGGDVRPLLAIVSAEGPPETLASILHGAARSRVYVVSALDGGTFAGSRDAYGASVVFAETGEDIDGEELTPETHTLALTIGRDQALHLEPVAVRRDTSARWVARAEHDDGPFGGTSDDGDSPGDAPRTPSGPSESAAPDEPSNQLVLEPQREAVQADQAASVTGDSDSGSDVEDDAVRLASREITEEGANDDAGSAAERPPVSAARAATEATAPRGTRQAALFTESDLSGTADARAEPPIFRVQCLGPFQVWARGDPVERWPLEKSRELLAFLIAHGGASVAREVVAEALWPGYDWDASLKHTLSNTATTLRSTLRGAAGDSEMQPLVAARQRLQLPGSLFAVDLDAFEAALRRAGGLPDVEALDEYERALDLYQGDFLEGEFFAWLDSYRMDYLRRFIDAARRAGTIAEGLPDPARAARLYRAILEREPTDEDAARAVMRSLASAGDVAGARKTFKALAEALVREFDDPAAQPSAETRAALSELVGATANG